ncbi:MAG: CobW family GTP-binding protein [Ilumatobacteraceae bacterium]
MTSASPIPVVIIGGYLGAGKTTLINHCLQNGLRNAAIIVNDFGDINIDASLISQFSSDTLELTNGCICCTIGETLADTLFSILDRPTQPEVIVIETSGVSDPATVAAYSHIGGLTNAGILVLVDALQALSTFQKAILKKTFERQIESAHVLAITKSELVEEQDLADLRQLLHELAPGTAVINATPDVLTHMVTATSTISSATPLPSIDHSIRGHVHHFSAPPTLDELHSFLHQLDHSVIRVKGVVTLDDLSCVLVQKTGPHLSVTPSGLSPSGLVLLRSE